MEEKNSIILAIYGHLIGQIESNKIPVTIRPKTTIGTVQDDPFDEWVREQIGVVFPQYDIVPTGPLMTPDIIIHDPATNLFLSIEVKKLVQKANGSDPRGLTLDYNSCLPCGSALIKVDKETLVIPCFYLFALISPDSQQIVGSIFMDGDFLNYDFNLHKEAKYANVSEYGHGPYGEGSVRNRKMYTYPNPLNSKLSFLHLRHTLIVKKPDFETFPVAGKATDIVVRDDIYGNSFHYLVIDGLAEEKASPQFAELPHRTDIFKACKQRLKKDRVASIPHLMSKKK
ncbi:hypothetical protein [Spirosoma utsteinense]|uniref:Restriction endonuclease n=1 Tax=Spirosoma utsteinense TaxID=2585773 RepID=A0ABR6WFD0_9BACT|nr:hypothetical protein [Spirosoma utsteinense]MBC3794974.1 hypothetical protein [Spirosoma utsteinense]